MTPELAKRLMDAFYSGERIRAVCLPPLPDGILPSYIHVLDAFTQLSKTHESVRVSDISTFLDLPRPGVTRTLQAMEKNGLIQKERSSSDARIVNLKLTKQGQLLYQQYVEEQFTSISSTLSSVSDEDVTQLVRTVTRIRDVLMDKPATR